MEFTTFSTAAIILVVAFFIFHGICRFMEHREIMARIEKGINAKGTRDSSKRVEAGSEKQTAETTTESKKIQD